MNSTSYSKILHTILLNLTTNVFTIDPPIYIHQGDNNSHILLIQLCTDNEEYYCIDNNIQFIIEFYKNKKLVMSKDVSIVNKYRGLISYNITRNITTEFGRYTVYIKMIDKSSSDIVNTSSFPITVNRSHNYNPDSSEVIIDQDEYLSIINHINNKSIHLTESDKCILNVLSSKGFVTKIGTSEVSGKILVPTPTESDNSLQVVNKEYVDNSLLITHNNINYKGTLGINQDYTELPNKHKLGELYLVVTPGEYVTDNYSNKNDMILSIVDTTDMIINDNSKEWIVLHNTPDNIITASVSTSVIGNLPIYNNINGTELIDSKISIESINNTIKNSHHHNNLNLLDSYNLSQKELLGKVDNLKWNIIK